MLLSSTRVNVLQCTFEILGVKDKVTFLQIKDYDMKDKKFVDDRELLCPLLMAEKGTLCSFQDMLYFTGINNSNQTMIPEPLFYATSPFSLDEKSGSETMQSLIEALHYRFDTGDTKKNDATKQNMGIAFGKRYYPNGTKDTFLNSCMDGSGDELDTPVMGHLLDHVWRWCFGTTFAWSDDENSRGDPEDALIVRLRKFVHLDNAKRVDASAYSSLLQYEKEMEKHLDSVEEKEWKSVSLEGFQNNILSLNSVWEMGESVARKRVLELAKDRFHLNEFFQELNSNPKNTKNSESTEEEIQKAAEKERREAVKKFLGVLDTAMKKALGVFYEYYRRGYIVRKTSGDNFVDDDTHAVKIFDFFRDFVRTEADPKIDERFRYMSAKEINVDLPLDVSVLHLIASDIGDSFPETNPLAVDLTEKARKIFERNDLFNLYNKLLKRGSCPMLERYRLKYEAETNFVSGKIKSYKKLLACTNLDFRRMLCDWTYPLFPAPKLDPSSRKRVEITAKRLKGCTIPKDIIDAITKRFPLKYEERWIDYSRKIRSLLPQSPPEGMSRDEFLKAWIVIENQLAEIPSQLQYPFYERTTVDPGKVAKSFHARLSDDLKTVNPIYVFESMVKPILKFSKNDKYRKFLAKKKLRERMIKDKVEDWGEVAETFRLNENETNVLKKSTARGNFLEPSRNQNEYRRATRVRYGRKYSSYRTRQ